MRINLVERDKWSGAAEGIFRMFMFLTIGFLAALPRIFGKTNSRIILILASFSHF